MQLIGFGHRARQGKNTAAQAVLESLPLATEVHMYAFADALKREVRTLCAKYGGQWELIRAWQEEGVMPPSVHFEEPKPRSLLQWYGTEFRRKQDPEVWVKRLRKTLEEHNPDVALITDVRFPNEAEYIKQQGGTLIKCVRTTAADVEVAEHWSEAALDSFTGWDFVLTADTAEECKAQAVAIYQTVRAREQVHISGLRNL
jgi:hypothetical protein